MENECSQKYKLCHQTAADSHFELKTFPKGTIGHSDDTHTNYLIYCQSGSVRISSTLFYDEFNFSSPQQFSRFCKDNLGDTPTNIRQTTLDNDNRLLIYNE